MSKPLEVINMMTRGVTLMSQIEIITGNTISGSPDSHLEADFWEAVDQNHVSRLRYILNQMARLKDLAQEQIA